MPIRWLLLATIALACGEYRMNGPTRSSGGSGAQDEPHDADAEEGNVEEGEEPSPTDEDEESNDSSDDEVEDQEGRGASTGIRHKVFVHGWGPPAFSSLQPLMKKMSADGVPADRLHEVKYDYNSSLAQMSSEIATQIKAVLDDIPEGERVDVIGYSLGTFASVHAVLDKGLHERVGMMISLAGVERGQQKKPANCLFRCPDIYDFLSPFENDDVKAFYADHPEWKDVSKCAVHSPNDGMLNPYDSNAFPESKVASVPGVSHIQMPKSDKVFEAIKKTCYDGKWE